VAHALVGVNAVKRLWTGRCGGHAFASYLASGQQRNFYLTSADHQINSTLVCPANISEIAMICR